MKKLAEMTSSAEASNKLRLNKSGACRVLGWKTKQLEDALNECRKILGPDVND